MWDDDDDSLLFEKDTWIDGAYNGPQRSKILEDWKKSKKYKLVSRDWPIWRAKKALSDLSQVALKWTKQEVKDKLTSSATSELVPSSVFNEDLEGGQLESAIVLRALKKKDGSPDRKAQEEKIVEIIQNSPDVTPEIACLLEKYCSLSDTEFLHVKELIRVYDHSRRYFVRDILDTSMQQLVNSERLEAEFKKQEFKWKHYEATILKQLINIEVEAQLFNFVNEQRGQGTTAKLWASQRIQAQAILEGSGKVKLHEDVYLTYLVGWMSDQEINVFGLPAIGDDFTGWTLKKAKEQIDKCTKPPKFKWTETPLSRMVKDKVKSHPQKEQHGNEVKTGGKKGDKKNGKNNGKTPQKLLDQRPEWEKPSAFPPTLKTPDDKYARQKQLHADIVSGACTRCHKHGHLRRNCPEPAEAWEKNFDRKGKKGIYWQSVADAQAATDPEQQMHTFSPESHGNSSFSAGHAIKATGMCTVYPKLTAPEETTFCPSQLDVTIGLDSQSDVSVAAERMAYCIRNIEENVSTGGGTSTYSREGVVDIVFDDGHVEAIPVLIANKPWQLPRNCDILLGMQQIRELRISLDAHSKEQHLRLTRIERSPQQMMASTLIDEIYDDMPVQMMSEKDLLKWWEANKDKPANYVPYTVGDVNIYPGLSDEEFARVREETAEYADVFDAMKGSLPKLANHPPVELNFKDDWRPVPCPEPRWGPGSLKVITKWAEEQLASGLYVRSRSQSASRLHVVKKPPPGAPKSCPVEECSLRFCGDHRRPNSQLKKSTSTLPNGQEELQKLGGWEIYWGTDMFGMYNAYGLAEGPSRELLAVHTPIGLLEPTRCIFGEKNAGQVCSAPVRAEATLLPDNAIARTAVYVDDVAQGNLYNGDIGAMLKGWTDFLKLCRKNNWTLNATKTFIGYPSIEFFGFRADKDGFRLADKNLDPIVRMVEPKDLSELRHVLGVFVQSQHYIPLKPTPYAELVLPLTRLTRKDVPFVWTPACQRAFDTVREFLLSGVHLHAPDFRLPFYSGGDASNDGKSYGLWQFSDVKPSTKFTVVSHGPTHTTIHVEGEPEPRDIAHTDENRKQIKNFSKTWKTPALANRPPFYLEADALLWGLDVTRFWSLSSPFPIYAQSDHLPLKWVKHSEKGPVSAYQIERLWDVDWVHSYVPGPSNHQDSYSRYPMLGPRQLAPLGLEHSVKDLLQRLPERLQQSARVQVFMKRSTAQMAKLVQDWKQTTKPIIQRSISALHPPTQVDLIIAQPAAGDSPRVVARLMHVGTPFAVLMPTDLAPQITDPNLWNGTDIPIITEREAYKELGKIVYLETDLLWVVGNIPELSAVAEIYDHELTTPAPLCQFSGTVSGDNTELITKETILPGTPSEERTLPTSLEEWADAQAADDSLLEGYEAGSIADVNGLKTFVGADFPTLIIVPLQLREPLVRKVHADLQHVNHRKVLDNMSKHYFWKDMKKDVRKTCEDCAACENEKATRHKAHGMFRAAPSSGPRSRYCMDFQGQGKAKTGECEALACIDSFSKYLFVFALVDRHASTLAPRLLDEIVFTHGAIDIIHSDEAPEFTSRLQEEICKVLGIKRTTNLGHHAEGNAEVEIVWRYWNRCMRILSPAMYERWPEFAQRIAFAYNTTPQEGLGEVSPYEVMFGIPPRSPFALDPSTPPPADLDAELVDREPGNPREFALALRESTAAFARLARAHQTYARQTTADRLNMQGMSTRTMFAEGDKVKIYVPPTAADIARTGRKSKHIVAWRGPCTVTKQISDTAYEMKEDSTGRTFRRTLVNLRPYRASTAAPPPHHDPLAGGPASVRWPTRRHPRRPQCTLPVG